MKVLPLSVFKPIPVQKIRNIARTPLENMSTAQLIKACNKSAEQLEEMALDAEVKSLSEAVVTRHEFLSRHPNFRRPEEIN